MYTNPPPDRSDHSHEGTINEVIEPGKTWRVHAYGSLWQASSKVTTEFEIGDRVLVVDRNGNKLLIEPLLPQQ